MTTTQAAIRFSYAKKNRARSFLKKVRQAEPLRRLASAAGRMGAYLDAHPAALWFAGFVVCPLLVVCAVMAAAFLFSLPWLLM